MAIKCCITNCNSQRPNVTLFRFPKTEIGLNHSKWINCIPRGSFKNFDELRKMYICEKHFEKRFIASSFRLRHNAYPTLFTAHEIASGFPDTLVKNIGNINPNIDHNYSLPEHSDHTYSLKQGLFIDEATRCGNSQLPSLPEEYSGPCSTDKTTIEPSTSKPINISHTNIRTPKKKKKHIVLKTALLTPNCKKLYKQFNKCKRKLEFCKKTKAIALSSTKEKSFDFLTKGVPDLGKRLMWMQIQQAPKNKKGRRFTEEDKLICLSIMKQSPKCYRFLQKIFILPGKTTLNKFVTGLALEPGINKQIFEAISKEVKSWDENRKFCSILFDEVALEANLIYEKSKDVIDGLVNLDTKTNDIADHALCFMLRGAFYKWQQPITFYFCKGQTTAHSIKNIIRSTVTEVCKTGLKPITLICDQGAAFQSALKNLQDLAKQEQILKGLQVDETITINGCKLNIMYDPPHLFKGLRNNFLSKDLKFEGRVAKWSDIVEVYKTDCKHAHSRLLHKINDECVIPEKIKKMKVKNCARVFSKTMAATLSYTSEFSHYSDGIPVSGTLQNTAKVVEFFDNLFDSVNGSSFKDIAKGKELRSIVTKESKHHHFWDEAILKLSELKYINKNGKETAVPTIKNWLTTLKSFKRLWRFCEEKNIKFLRPRYFNSDPIENFFGQMRAYNYRNTNPDCHTFKNTFKALLITRFIQFHSITFNCEEDSSVQLIKLKSLFECQPDTHTDFIVTAGPSQPLYEINPVHFYKTAIQLRLNVHSQAYTTGWVVRKILKNLKCSTCESDLISDDINSIHKWISHREFKTIKNRKLMYPSEKAVSLFEIVNKETIQYLEYQPEKRNIRKSIKDLIKTKYSMDFFTCDVHKDSCNLFLEYTLVLIIYNWCKSINNILRGTDVSRLPKDLLPMQAKAFNKYKMKFKNKKVN